MSNKNHKQPEQLSLPFPDYPPEAQQKDRAKAARLARTEVYVMKVNGCWGAYVPQRKYPISINSLDRNIDLNEFIPDVKSIIERQMSLKPNFHYIRNDGVSEHLINQFIIQNKLLKGIDK